MTTDAAETDFDLAYRTHYAGVHRFVFRLVDDAALADELAQDTFLKAYRAWEGFRGEASVRTWLFRIARNTSLDHLRSPRSRTHAIEGTTGHEGAEPADRWTSLAGADPELGVAASVRRIEMTACVRDFVDDLPETLRTPLILHDLEGFSNAEIADLLECSLAAAKMRLHRARRELRQLVDNNCDLFYDERNVLSCLPGPPETSAPAFKV
ncbi:MAG: RNA polymerase sigma factor [Actinomycetia bacterium]|nr:RNA polymerase sigma factor [Actinomycetes bacterium]